MFKTIMLALDASKYADSVLKHGIDLANKFKSHVTVLSVADVRIFEWATSIGTDGFVPLIPSGAYESESRKLVEEKCERIIEKASEILQKENIEFEIIKYEGSPPDVIVEKSSLADIVVMGKRGEYERWDNDSLGATVDTVSRHITKPLFVSKKEYRDIKNILIGYDGSAHANNALQCCGHLAEAFHAQITIISVTDDEELGKHYLQDASNYLLNYEVTCQTRIISGAPHKAIVKFADDHGIDLISIGAYGHSRIKQAILGSTTEQIIRFAKCPVLMVN